MINDAPVLTSTAARALDLVVKCGTMNQRHFGVAMWPHLSMPKCMGPAGSYLSRLAWRGLIRLNGYQGYKITRLGLQSLAAHDRGKQ